MRSKLRYAVPFALTLGALLILGCGGGDDGGTNPEPNIELANVTLSTDNTAPMTRIEVNGLPKGKAGLAYEVVFVDVEGADQFRLPLEIPAEGSAWFHAPFHPTLPTTGGTAQLQIVGGSNRSPVLDLDLGTLPAAPGAFQNYVTLLREHIDQRAKYVGSSFDALVGTDITAVEPRLTPLKFAQLFVEDSANPDCLARVADGTSTYFDETQRDMLDRIFGFARIDSVVQADIDHMTGTPATSLNWSQAGVDKEGCVNMGPTVSVASELAEAMQAAFAAKIATSGAPGEILGATGLALGAAAFVPGLGGVAAVAGAGLYAYQTSREYIANTYPSEFVSLTFDLDRSTLPEDETGFAQWSNVQVIAMSTGWVADKAIFDAIMQLVGAGMGAAKVGKIKNSEGLRDAALNDFGMSVGFALEGNQEGVVEFCSQRWGVDITDLPYSKGQAIIGRVSTTEFREIRPVEVGSDVIRVRAEPAQFGFKTISAELPIETKAILVTATPDVIMVKTPGEIVDITTTIEHAEVQKLDWRPEQGQWDDGKGNETNEPTTRPLKTPLAENAYPFLVTVESMSREGLRAGGEPARLDIVTVKLQKASIIVTPGGTCVGHGEKMQFSAEVEGLEDTTVDWSLEPAQSGGAVIGSINQSSGLYSAPGSGTAKMFAVATSREDSEVVGRAYFDVGTCACSWLLTIDGETWAGDFATHAFTADAGFFSMEITYLDSSIIEGGTIQIFPPAALDSGNLGTWDATFVWQTTNRSWVSTNEDEMSSALTVLTNTGDQMISEASGTVLTVINGEEHYVSFNLTMRSANLFGGLFCEEE